MYYVPFSYLFDGTLDFISLLGPKFFILMALSFIYDIMALIVLFRVWRVNAHLVIRLVIFICTVLVTPLGFGVYLFSRWKFGVVKPRPANKYFFRGIFFKLKIRKPKKEIL